MADFGQSTGVHFEHADLVGRSEPVLDTAQDPELVVAVALEVEHGVDEMLEDAGTGNCAFLGDMPDQDDRDAGGFGPVHDPGGRFADLTDAAGCGIEIGGVDGLDRVDDQQGGFDLSRPRR